MSVDIAKLRAPFPATAIKQRAGGGGRMLAYVEGFTVIHRLNDACSRWDFTIIREWQDGPLMKAQVQLCLDELGCRQHVGVQVIADRPGAEDVQAKGHITDALKKAATLFGVGLELYGPDYEAGEVGPAVNGNYQQPRPSPPQQQPAVQQARPQASPNRGLSEKQLRYIRALAAEKGVDDADLHAHAGVPSLNDLNSKGASDLIEWLQARPAGIAAGPRQEPQRGWEQGQRAFEHMPPPEPPPDDYDRYGE